MASKLRKIRLKAIESPCNECNAALHPLPGPWPAHTAVWLDWLGTPQMPVLPQRCGCSVTLKTVKVCAKTGPIDPLRRFEEHGEHVCSMLAC